MVYTANKRRASVSARPPLVCAAADGDTFVTAVSAVERYGARAAVWVRAEREHAPAAAVSFASVFLLAVGINSAVAFIRPGGLLGGIL